MLEVQACIKTSTLFVGVCAANWVRTISVSLRRWWLRNFAVNVCFVAAIVAAKTEAEKMPEGR